VKTLLPGCGRGVSSWSRSTRTILNTAVPTIAAALHVAPLSMKVALTSYTLAWPFHPRSGWMADRYGHAVSSPSDRHLQPRLVPVRRGEQHSHVGSSSHPAGLWRLHDVPVGRLTLVRTFERHELVRVLSSCRSPPWSVRWWVRSRGIIVAICTGVSFSS